MQLNSNHIKILKGILWVLHIVGAAGTVYPPTRELVVPLTPANLILSVLLLALAHRESFKTFIYFFVWAFSIGMIVEIVGVQTSFPFGEYSYGAVLGWKVLGVPLLIGINWFMLAYTLGDLAGRTTYPPFIKALLGGAGMALLDFLIEPVAIHLHYWNWASTTVPIQNYLAWFIIGFTLQIPLQSTNYGRSISISAKNCWNPLSSTLVFAQILYFSVVFIFTNL
ncbi:carotenoid biosynthesis protein [Marinoscillum furvescens]|uniref:Putative membrane protein n=1 Tax=Marinoscillum furvescens DSM 4134 TaxID=1122208 RepID=A0A3D9LKW3_MARFU|nr:carotenoid biosynthesis protein [Marinoscillum furvescens]REE05902.1 putative membrane protein [Marinoscillum furvescens DSM 4134]